MWTNTTECLFTVEVSGACGRQAEIIGLRRAQGRQLDAELVEVEGGDLLVVVFGQH
jgi:hypothetical protein